MVFWLATAGYAAVWFVAARAAYLKLNEDDDGTEDDFVMRFAGAVAACTSALLWPLWLPVFAVMARRPPTRRRLLADLADRDRRIAALERALEIEPTVPEDRR